eukprot:CAMPEP_0183734148 /NCGR_PEP_ID=MMETSP0737-20130205/43048_1 /TAXON_ID=385413 /ORGANISM="Thalassiosira miniscula, Strain CCMP1093" /LENGTH=74 /DNA_ID=CAMNT_0025967571 /DNA_START=26 /DNA_END=247 /DNA_ORIENTATION=+
MMNSSINKENARIGNPVMPSSPAFHGTNGLKRAGTNNSSRSSPARAAMKKLHGGASNNHAALGSIAEMASSSSS